MTMSERNKRLTKINRKNPSPEDIAFLRDCVAAGHADGTNNLAVLYFYGEGVEQDYTEAFRLFTLANSMDPNSSLRHLGDMYFFGLGTAVNYEKAFACYQKDVERKHYGVSSEDRLADCYLRGRGVEVDPVKAAELFRATADGIEEMERLMAGNLGGSVSRKEE